VDEEGEVHPGEASHVVVEEADKGSLMHEKLNVLQTDGVKTSSHDFTV
jgi:hypothetical protein